MGKSSTLTGIRYLPRMESNVPGAIKDFRVYVSETPFKK